MDQYLYGGAIRVRGGTLEGVAPDGTAIWRWCPPAIRIVGVLAVRGGGEAIVLAEPVASLPKGVPTLFRCRSDGSLAWTAEVPPGGDGTYVAVEPRGDDIAANTWDGRRVTIDVDTGHIKDWAFVK